MISQRGRVATPTGVTVASSNDGAPRLDFPRFSLFGQYDVDDDASKSALPRAKSSNDILTKALQEADSEDAASFDERDLRARIDGDRSDMSDLIQFLRTQSPPPQNYLPSAFEDDVEPSEGPGKWKSLRKKFRFRLPRAQPSEVSPAKGKLPGSAISAKTTSGSRHIAISIPSQHCPLAPAAEYGTAAFNPTKPLPASPPLGDNVGDGRRSPRKPSQDRGLLSAPATSHGEEEWPSQSRNDSPSRLMLEDFTMAGIKWPHGTLLSPPESPHLPSSKVRETPRGPPPSTPPKIPLPSMPSNPRSYNELPPVPPSPPTPESVAEERKRKAQVSWMRTTHVLESAAGPPPRTAPHSGGSGSPVRRFSSRQAHRQHLPTRSSSLQNFDQFRDETLASQLSSTPVEGSRENPQEQVLEPNKIVESNDAGDESNSAPHHETLDLLPAEAYAPPAVQRLGKSSSLSNPRKSFLQDKKLGRRAARVKSLKQRDMEAMRARTNQILETQAADAREHALTARSSISSLHLPSRPGSSVANFAEQFPRPPTAASTAEDQPGSFSRPVSSAGHEDVFLATSSSNTLRSSRARRSKRPDSSCSAGLPPRMSSAHRSSCASSIPLLDRFSSHAPSESSFMQILDSVKTETNLHRRSDSATLPAVEMERLATSNLSRVVSMCENEERVEAAEPAQPHTSGNEIETPQAVPVSRFSTQLPPPSTSQTCVLGERKDSISTLASPCTIVPPSTPATSVSNSFELARTSGDYSTCLDVEPALFGPPLPTAHSSTYRILEEDSDGSDDRGQNDSATTIKPQRLSRLDDLVQQRGSNALLRMSSSEVQEYHSALRSSDRNTGIAHHMLLSQARLEGYMRKQEHSMRKQEHNQMVLINTLQPLLENLYQRLPDSSPASSPKSQCPPYWNTATMESEVETKAARRCGVQGPFRRISGADQRGSPQRQKRIWIVDEAATVGSPQEPRKRQGHAYMDADERAAILPWTDERQTPKQRRISKPLPQSPVPTKADLEMIEPLMRELQGASRISHESSRTPPRLGEGGPPVAPAVGGREMDVYFNMI